jgi:hypothetical protein
MRERGREEKLRDAREFMSTAAGVGAVEARHGAKTKLTDEQVAEGLKRAKFTLAHVVGLGLHWEDVTPEVQAELLALALHERLQAAETGKREADEALLRVNAAADDWRGRALAAEAAGANARRMVELLEADLAQARGYANGAEARATAAEAERDEARQERERTFNTNLERFYAHLHSLEDSLWAVKPYLAHRGQVCGGPTCAALSTEFSAGSEADCSCGLAAARLVVEKVRATSTSARQQARREAFEEAAKLTQAMIRTDFLDNATVEQREYAKETLRDLLAAIRALAEVER